MEDYYSILGVQPTDDLDTIKKAYRKLALVCHPDKGADTEAFQKIQKAWSVLSDPVLRTNYDKVFLADNTAIANEVFPFSEFEKRNSEDSYYHYCRCGGVFEIYQEEVDQKMDLIECSECSLICQIKY